MSQTAAQLVLTDDHRAELGRWSQDGSPMLATGLGLARTTVRKWRRRFAEAGLDGLTDHDRPGRPVAPLVLNDAERDQLIRWARRAKSTQALALRARIVLSCAEGLSNKQA